MGSPESTEGEKSPTWVNCSVRKKSNIEILMTIFGFLESYWLFLMGSCEKFRTFNFFHCFWLDRQNFNDGRPRLGFLGRANFFSEKVSYIIAFSQSLDYN
jgi:hypothetical protein